MSKRLKNLAIGKIDLVGSGDNPLAHVAMYKAAPMVACPECGKQMPKGGKCPECGYKAKPFGKEGAPPTCTEILDTRAQADALQQLQYAFSDSMYGILYGGGDSKVELMRKNVEAFGARLKDITGKAAEVAAMKSLSGEEPEAFVARAAEWIDSAISKARETMKTATLDVNAIPEAQRPAVEALQKSATDQAAALAAITTERDTLKARIVTLEAAPEDDLAGVPELTKARILKERVANKATADKVEKLEAEREQDRRIAKVRTEHAQILGTTPEALGAALYRMEKGKSTPEDVVEFERLIKSLTEQARSGNVTFEGGTSTGDDARGADAASEFKKKADALVAAKTFPNYKLAADHLLATDHDLRKRMSERSHAGDES